jgi:integrase
MTWDEIDFQAKRWTVPASRMKAGREHRVPLTDRCIEILTAMAPLRRPAVDGADPLVFPGLKRGKPLSDMTLAAVLKRKKVAVTVHGFRSTFRDWAAERTSFPREVAEAALAHTIENETEAAYRRGDLFEKRRRLMSAWATFALSPPPTSNVTPLVRVSA